MQIGLIGAGNMARALARGWDRPVLCTDVLPQRAEALARETGGQALPGAADVARGADLVVLCHKPAQLAEVAAQTGGEARAVVSILGGVPRADVAAAYPDRPVYRVLPSTPVEVRQGVVLLARAEPQPLDDAITELFGGLGLLVPLDEELIDTGMGLMSTAPAYYALVAEAQVDAGVRHGLPADRAAQLVVQTMAGTAALLKHRDYDTLAARREVTSPGGSTARGLDALERAGIRAAFSDALDSVRRQGARSR
jgi:pyrroline-5-carboxylate reductase